LFYLKFQQFISRYRLPFLIGGLFAIINAILIVQEEYFFPLLPGVLGVFLLALFSLDKLFYMISFLTPLSVILEDYGLGATLSLPSEALLLLAVVVFLLKIFHENSYSKKLLIHPVSILIFCSLAWVFFTSLTSTMPIVSFKNLAARLWFIIPCYFLGIQVFKRIRSVHYFIWLHLAGLLIVIAYTTYRHYLWGFAKDPAHFVMTPFYNDHTAYGMILALFLPYIIHFVFNHRMNLFFRLCGFAYLLIHLLAFRLSNSRAAWLSVAVAIVVWLLIQFRVRWYVFTLFLILFGALLWSMRVEIQHKLSRNKIQSSENFDEQLRSITNISTDPSNLERFNRWKSAIRMFQEKPWIGFGPGTYQFQYAPYQSFLDLTIISTNAGNQGTAHSEYLLVLSEQGLPGLILLLLSIGFLFSVGNSAYNHIKCRYERNTILAILLGLVTYWTHAFLNNFLDTDKAAVPYFSMIAMTVSAHVYWFKKK